MCWETIIIKKNIAVTFVKCLKTLDTYKNLLLVKKFIHWNSPNENRFVGLIMATMSSYFNSKNIWPTSSRIPWKPIPRKAVVINKVVDRSSRVSFKHWIVQNKGSVARLAKEKQIELLQHNHTVIIDDSDCRTLNMSKTGSIRGARELYCKRLVLFKVFVVNNVYNNVLYLLAMLKN